MNQQEPSVLKLGQDVATKQMVELTVQARRQGVYVIGTTGTGKTTLLKNIAYQDMTDPKRPAVIVLDPHGDFTHELLDLVPDNRRDDVIVFAPGEQDFIDQPLGLNLLACDRTSPLERRLVTSTVVDTLHKLFVDSWGPRMEDLLRHAILSLMETPDTTLLDLLLMLASYPHRQEYRKNVTDPVLRHYWEQQFPESRLDQYGNMKTPREQVELVGSSLNKIGRFLVDPLIRNVVAQPKNAFSIREVMDTGKILLINLSKGLLGEDNSSLLGAVIINLILIAALRRGDTAPGKRHPVHLIVDEYQSFATESFPTLQSEARKYAIDLVVAHQYRDQLDRLNRGSTLNVANFIVMRTSGIDSTELAMQFDNTPPRAEDEWQPVMRPSQHFPGEYVPEPRYILTPGKPRMYTDVAAEMANTLAYLPNYEGICRLVNDTGRLEKHQFRGLYVTDIDQNAKPNLEMAAYIRQRSLARGVPLADIETYIRRKMGRIDFYEVAQGEIAFVERGDEGG